MSKGKEFMNLWNNLSFVRVALTILTFATLSGLDGCASKPAPAPALPPPPTSSVEAIPGPTVLTQDQMTKLCNAAPGTCQRIQLGQQLTEDDVATMARLGFPADTITNELRFTRSVFHLAASDIIALKNAGVSDSVVGYMLSTPSAIAEVAPAAPPPAEGGPAVAAQVPPPAPLVETQPPSPGVDYVWVGGDWVWNGGWVWAGGRWAIPPYPHAVWYRGGWRRGGDGYHHGRGHWR
jgi:hypothetical protein